MGSGYSGTEEVGEKNETLWMVKDDWCQEEQIQFQAKFTKLSQSEREFILHSIENLSFFFIFPLQVKQNLISKFKLCSSKNASYLFKQGDYGRYFFVIGKGKVVVEQNGYIIRRLCEGDCFGELALLYDEKRTCSIRVPKDYKCENKYYVVERQDYWRAIKEMNKQNMNEIQIFLNQIHIFDCLTKRQKKRLIENLIERKFNPNERILTRFDNPYAFFIIKQGKAKLGFLERESVLVEKYAYFGYYGHDQNQMSAIACQNLVCYTIGKHKLRQVLGQSFKYFYLWNRLRITLLLNKCFNHLSFQQIEVLSQQFSFQYVKEYKVLCSRNQPIEHVTIPLSCHQKDSYDIFGLSAIEGKSQIFACDLVSISVGYCAIIEVKQLKRFLDYRFSKKQVGRGFQGYKIMSKGKKKNQFFCKEQKFKIRFSLRRREGQSGNLQKSVFERLCHSSIISFYKISQSFNEIAFYCQYRLGVSLFSLVIREGILSLSIIKFYASCIVNILDYMHDNSVFHRSLSLQEFVIQKCGFLFLSDFSNSKIIEKTKRTSTVLGLPYYHCPSIVKGEGYSFEADFWAVGVILYFLMFSKFPFGDGQESVVKIYKSILHEDLIIPENRDCRKNKEVLSYLFERNCKKRSVLNWKQIKKFQMFRSVNWEALDQKKVEVPYFPSLKQEPDF